MLAVLAVTGITLVRLHTGSPLERDNATVVADALPRLAFLRDTLDRGAADQMQRLFPEGYVFSYLLYGLSWVQVGRRDNGMKERAIEQARWALSHVESDRGREVFDERLDPPYGVFYAGWSSWLRGQIAALSGERDARLAADVAALARAFDRSRSPFLPAYPGQAWPCDSVVAMAAIRQGDRLLGTDHGALARDWLAAANAQRDPVTGLLGHTDASGSGARATSQVIILRFLPEVDADLARRDWHRFGELFGSPILGLPGVREYPRGVDGAGDVDSGPLPLGLSLSASTVALGDAVIYGDRRAAAALTGLAEATGLATQWDGRRRYAAGVLPIGDSFLAWSMTAQPMPAAQTKTGWPSRFWRLPWYATLYLAWLLLLASTPLARSTGLASPTHECN